MAFSIRALASADFKMTTFSLASSASGGLMHSADTEPRRKLWKSCVDGDSVDEGSFADTSSCGKSLENCKKKLKRTKGRKGKKGGTSQNESLQNHWKPLMQRRYFFIGVQSGDNELAEALAVIRRKKRPIAS